MSYIYSQIVGHGLVIFPVVRWIVCCVSNFNPENDTIITPAIIADGDSMEQLFSLQTFKILKQKEKGKY